LRGAAIVTATGAHWESADSLSWSTDTVATAAVLDVLARFAPDDNLLPQVVRWLMVARRADRWQTTYETAWATISLTDAMLVSGDLAAAYSWRVALNGQTLADAATDAGSLADTWEMRIGIPPLLRDVGNHLTIARTDGPGRLYYTAHLRVFLPVEEIEPVDRGIIVSRRYTLADCQDGPRCPEAREVKLGDEIRVDLTIIAPNDLYYVVVEDPLPAGAEAIDTGLATTSMLAMDPTLRRQHPSEEVGCGDTTTGGGTGTAGASCATRRWCSSPTTCAKGPTSTATQCAPPCPATTRSSPPWPVSSTSRRCSGGVAG